MSSLLPANLSLTEKSRHHNDALSQSVTQLSSDMTPSQDDHHSGNVQSEARLIYLLLEKIDKQEAIINRLVTPWCNIDQDTKPKTDVSDANSVIVIK